MTTGPDRRARDFGSHRTRSKTFRRLSYAAAAVLLSAWAAVPSHAESDGFQRIRLDQLTWIDVPNSYGVRVATVLGDPSRPGFYIQRVRFPAGVMDRPHRHADERYVTVLSGTWCTGTGERFDPAQAVPMSVGGVMHHPARGIHWDGSCNNQPVEVQVTGFGPTSQDAVDPKTPMWVQVKTDR